MNQNQIEQWRSMKTLLQLSAVVSIALIIASCSLPGLTLQQQLYEPAGSTEKESYFPFEVGRTWIYGYTANVGIATMPGYVVTKVVGKLNPNDPSSPYLIAARNHTALISTDQKLIIGKTSLGVEVYRTDVKAEVGGVVTGGVGANLGISNVNTPPSPEGPQGHKGGDKWTSKYQNLTGMDPVSVFVNQFGDFWNDRLAALMKKTQDCKIFESTNEITRHFEHLGEENVSTVLGEFQTIKIKHYIEGSDTTQIDYYAKGIGLIRQQAFAGGDMASPIFDMVLLSTLPDDGEVVFSQIPNEGTVFNYNSEFEATQSNFVKSLGIKFDEALANECKKDES
jgi:hypothetical protein